MSGSDHGHSGMPHGTLRSYAIGFVLAVILTVIPFAIVMGGGLGSRQLALFVVIGCAIAQIIVHMVYFLHMNGKSEGGWQMTAAVFTAIVLFISILGTMWVMYNMDLNMMPGM